jgi:hypothetical protein
MANQEKKDDRQQHAPAAKPAPIASSAPIAETRASKLSNEEFAKWFYLFFKAVSHEVGNSVNIFRLFSAEKGWEKKETVTELIDSYTRLSILTFIASGKGYFEWSQISALFSQVEGERIGVFRSDNPALDGFFKPDFDGIREVGLAEVKKFRSLILELSDHFGGQAAAAKDESHKFHFNRAVGYGSILCDNLQKLMAGDMDFAADMVKLDIGDIEQGPSSSIAKRMESTASGHLLKTRVTSLGVTEAVAVEANPFFCTLIFENIASNAARALEIAEEKPVIDLYITPGNEMVAFRFTDLGCGMSRETMDKLNSGEQVSTKHEEGEHGLGFNYCAELARQMGGRLYVEISEEGIGTTVVLELKRAGWNQVPLEYL